MSEMARQVPSAEMNNMAVAFILSGQSQEAMELFQESLVMLRDQLASGRAPRSECVQMDKLESTSDTIHSGYNNNDDLLSLAGSNEIGDISLDSSFLAMYRRAMLVDINARSDDDTRLSGVVLYNMALLFHLRGLESNTADFLVRSLRLYELAIGIIENCPNHVPLDLVRLALFNNLAHLNFSLCRISDMKKYLKELHKMLSQECEKGNDCIDEDDFLLFSMNAMYGKEMEFAGAPSA